MYKNGYIEFVNSPTSVVNFRALSFIIVGIHTDNEKWSMKLSFQHEIETVIHHGSQAQKSLIQTSPRIILHPIFFPYIGRDTPLSRQMELRIQG